MDKLKMTSKGAVPSNVEKIAALFPNCVTERLDKDGNPEAVVDFDKLRQELSTELVEGAAERYQFTWPDKRAANHLANQPTTMTLRPCAEESVGKDGTNGVFDSENLYIEGDNLDVLKVLRETYLGKVKMIYIDPPYNTGSDFVYNDDFAESYEEFAEVCKVRDEEGNLTFDPKANGESNGRFHTDWLNMIYPRLKVARDLLSSSGVIFISIDNNEIENQLHVLDEIFGECNRLGIIANTNNPKGRSDDKFIATAHEYIAVYAREINSTKWYGFEPTEVITKRYNKVDGKGRRYREIDLRKTGENDLREDRPNLFYFFYFNEKTSEFFPSREKLCDNNFIEIKPQREDGKEGNWRWGIDTAKQLIQDLVPKFMPTRKVWGVMQKDYLEGRALVKPTSSWTFKDVNSERGTEDFTELGFDKRIFAKPKPIGTILRCLTLATEKDSIILDFFSGSATTAHAVMKLNAEDGGHRKFIMVQLPEVTDEKSEARKAGYNTICEIGKERIRRAGKQILESLKPNDGGLFANVAETPKLDIGFRVLKLAESNMEDVYYSPDKFDANNLFSLADNVKHDRTAEDLLFQVMLELGVELSSPIEKESINGVEVFNVKDGFLIATFDKDVNESTITEIAKSEPVYFVMRDASAANDNVLDNFDQLFRHYSPDTIRRIL
jgi:adenine-specific DNA-methyltransferase